MENFFCEKGTGNKKKYLFVLFAICFGFFLVIFINIDIVTTIDRIPFENQAVLTVAVKDRMVLFRPDVRSKLASYVRRIKNFVYREATVHNPSGDMLPDGLDDTVKGMIRDRIK